MKPEKSRIKTETMVEMATTVFKPTGMFQYKAVKSRNGDVIVGGTYSESFVKAYAKGNVNVYIVLGGR